MEIIHFYASSRLNNSYRTIRYFYTWKKNRNFAKTEWKIPRPIIESLKTCEKKKKRKRILLLKESEVK